MKRQEKEKAASGMILMDDLGSWLGLDYKELAALPSLSL